MKKKIYLCDLDKKLERVKPAKFWSVTACIFILLSLIAFVVFMIVYPIPEYDEAKYTYLESAAQNIASEGGQIDLNQIAEDVKVEMTHKQGEETCITFSVLTDYEFGPTSLTVEAKYGENYEFVSCERNYNEKRFNASIKREMIFLSLVMGFILLSLIYVIEIGLVEISKKHKKLDELKVYKAKNNS